MRKIILAMIALLFVTACTMDSKQPNQHIKELKVGVVGIPPFIKEEQVVLTQLTLEELATLNSLSNYDAVLIMENHLTEAAEAQYAAIYKTAEIPFFFIKSTKSYVPFIIEDLTYNEVPNLSEEYYAVGYHYYNERDISWSYGLHNNVENSTNIKDVYKRIFKQIRALDN